MIIIPDLQISLFENILVLNWCNRRCLQNFSPATKPLTSIHLFETISVKISCKLVQLYFASKTFQEVSIPFTPPTSMGVGLNMLKLIFTKQGFLKRSEHLKRHFRGPHFYSTSHWYVFDKILDWKKSWRISKSNNICKYITWYYWKYTYMFGCFTQKLFSFEELLS
jgi:hypothetical protein